MSYFFNYMLIKFPQVEFSRLALVFLADDLLVSFKELFNFVIQSCVHIGKTQAECVMFYTTFDFAILYSSSVALFRQ